MDEHIRNAIVIGTLAAVIVVFWIVICGMVRRKLPLQGSLLVLFGLSVLVSVILWWLKYLIIILFFVTSDTQATPDKLVYQWTFGLTDDLCDLVPSFVSMGDDFCYHTSPLLMSMILFFILGLAPMLLVKRQHFQTT